MTKVLGSIQRELNFKFVRRVTYGLAQPALRCDIVFLDCRAPLVNSHSSTELALLDLLPDAQELQVVAALQCLRGPERPSSSLGARCCFSHKL